MLDLLVILSVFIRYIVAYGDVEYCKMIMFYVRYGDEVFVVFEEVGYVIFGIRDVFFDKC